MMSDINQVLNNIKEEINQSEPSYSRIKTYLSDLPLDKRMVIIN